MKTIQFVRRLAASLIATTMMLGIAVSASAAENSSFGMSDETISTQSNITLATADEESWLREGIASGATVTGTVKLKSYIGLSKTINAAILPLNNGGTVTGKVHILVSRASDNETVAGFSIDPNGEWVQSIKLSLPKSGQYNITVYNQMNTSTYAHVYWS